MHKKLILAATLAAAFSAPMALATTAGSSTNVPPKTVSTADVQALLAKLATDRAALATAQTNYATASSKLREAQTLASKTAALVATDKSQEASQQVIVNGFKSHLEVANAELTKAQAALTVLQKDAANHPTVSADTLAQLKAKVSADNDALAQDAKDLVAANVAVTAAYATLKADTTTARQPYLATLNADQAAVESARSTQSSAMTALQTAQAKYKQDTASNTASASLAADAAAVKSAQAAVEKASGVVTAAVQRLQADYAATETAVAALPNIVADRQVVAAALASVDAVSKKQKADAAALSQDTAALRTASSNVEFSQKLQAAQARVTTATAVVANVKAQQAAAQDVLVTDHAKTVADTAALQTAQAAVTAASAQVSQSAGAVQAATVLVNADYAALRSAGYTGSGGVQL